MRIWEQTIYWLNQNSGYGNKPNQESQCGPETKYLSTDFTVLDKKVQGGSSASIQFFSHTKSNSTWIGKCSEKAIACQDNNGKLLAPDNISEYKESLAINLYSALGVETPKVILSKQVISNTAQETYTFFFDEYIQAFAHLPQNVPTLDAPRLHLMSRFVEGFHELGDKFLAYYAKQPKDDYCKVAGMPLKGFGRTLAVATFLYDYDCIGRSGDNMGYVIEDSYAQIVKIDAGEALPFVEDMSSAEGIKHDPRERNMFIDTGGTKISFSELNKAGKQEFAATAKAILECPDSQLETIFKEVISTDKRFEEVLKHLVERKSNFLEAFTPEVRKLLEIEMKKLQEDNAEEIQRTWLDTQKPIEENFRKLMLKQIELEKHNLKSNPTKFQVPQTNKNFVARVQELKTIDKALAEQNTCCIIGAGGLGKTDLANQYIHQANYQQIIWLHAEHNLILSQIQTYMEVLYNIAPKDMTQPDLVDRFYEILGQTKTVVVFDNAENEESIMQFLPKREKINVLITSRYKGWNLPNLLLTNFTFADADLYLQKRLGKEFSKTEIECLTKNLGGLPLAFVQAIGYLKQQPDMSIASYCELFENEQSKILSLGDPELLTIPTTMTLTLNNIRQKDSQIEPVLSVAAYLSGDNLAKALLESFLNEKIEKAIQFLLGYSILSTEGDKLKLHCLTQAVMRFIHKKSGLFEDYHKKLLQWILPQLYYDTSKQSLIDIARVSELIPHGLVLVGFENKKITAKDLGALLSLIGLHQEYGIGNYMQAKTCFEKAWDLIEKHYGKDHPQTGSTITDLANVYGSLGDYNKQKDLLLRALDIKEKYFGKDHQYTGKVLVNLGIAYGSLGDYENEKNFLIRGFGHK